MYPNIENKTSSDDINKPNIPLNSHWNTGYWIVEDSVSHKNVIRSFVYHDVVLIVLVMQNTTSEKNKKLYESIRNIIHPKYERLPLAVYSSHHVI